MPEEPVRMIVCPGKKRSLQALADVEVEVVSQNDESCVVTCRRCDDKKLVRLRRSLLKSVEAKTAAETTFDPQQKLRDDEQQWLTKFRTEILDLEDLIPWNGVTKSWKAKRGSWRKRIISSPTLQDLGEALKELLRCLVWEREYRLSHSILKWEGEIDDCCNDSGNHKAFAKLWKRLSATIHRWIQDRAAGTHVTDPSVSRRRADLALNRMKEAVHEGEAALRQVPLEAILHGDDVALGHLKAMVTGERKRLPDVTSPRKRQKQTQSAERSAAGTVD